VYISELVFYHCTLPIDGLLHPTGHAGDQVLEEGALFGALYWLGKCERIYFIETSARQGVFVLGR